MADTASEVELMKRHDKRFSGREKHLSVRCPGMHGKDAH